MTEEEKKLLLQDLCARLPYGVKATTTSNGWGGAYIVSGYVNDRIYLDCPAYDEGDDEWLVEFVKPYLRPMSSMTEEETRKICVLSGILTDSENILSISVKEEFIDIKIDDGVCSTETRTLWFTEMPTSITLFDYLNAHHFDYRGLIQIGLALPAKEGMYNFN